jgi:hypothetical protein
MLRFSHHARGRMAERGISQKDVESALRRTTEVRPGTGLGNLQVKGYDERGRLLEVVVRSDDREFVVTVWIVAHRPNRSGGR